MCRDFFIVLGLMTLDIISGVINTLAKGQKLSSAKMHRGLYKKAGILVCFITSVIISFYLIDIDYPLPVEPAVFAYICMLETTSIFENCGDSGIRKLLKGDQK